MDYWVVDTGPTSEPGIGGGLVRRAQPIVSTVNTIGGESIDACLEAVVANGGRVLRPESAFPGVG
jgi:predicted enzyme related to lactoylglutathione lyase